MTRRRSLALLALIALVAVSLPAQVGAAPLDAVARARADHDAIVGYWTPERMANAIPRDMVLNGGVHTSVPSATTSLSGSGKAGTAATCGTSSGTDWTCGGAALIRVGKIFMVFGSSNYVCSGSVVSDGLTNNGTSLVLTAGHCLYDNGTAKYATKFMFVPDWVEQTTTSSARCTGTKYGCWTSNTLVIHKGFKAQTSYSETAIKYDFGIAVVGLGGKADPPATELDGTVGAFIMDTSGLTGESSAWAFGYPAAKGNTGNNLIYCKQTIGQDPWYGSGKAWRMSPCSLTAGSSGGPWIRVSDDPYVGGNVLGLNNYIYSPIKGIHSTDFANGASSVQTTADGVASNALGTSANPNNQAVGTYP